MEDMTESEYLKYQDQGERWMYKISNKRMRIIRKRS